MKPKRLMFIPLVILLAGLLVAAAFWTSRSQAAALSPGQALSAHTQAGKSFWLGQGSWPGQPFSKPAAPNAELRGHVYTPGGAPVAYAPVYVFDGNGNIVGQTGSQLDGSYIINLLPPAFYMVIAHPPTPDPLGLAPSDKHYVEVQNPITFDDLYLNPRMVSGWVQNISSGGRPSDVWVVAHNADWSVEEWVLTDFNGNFFFTDVLSVGVPYTLELYIPPEIPFGLVAPVPVVPTATDVVVEVYELPVNITGTVTNNTGQPIPDALVYVANDTFYQETYAGFDGYYQFFGLPVGDYAIQAVPPWGYSGLLASDPISFTIFASNTFYHYPLILPPAAKTVYGNVIDSDSGLGVNDAAIWAARQDASGYNYTGVDAGGGFVMSLSGGLWEIGVEPQDWPAHWFFVNPPAWVEFNSDNSLPEETYVMLEVVSATAWLSGTIYCPDAQPCAGNPPTYTLWVDAHNEQIANGMNPDGNYQFLIPVLPGWYQVSLYAENPILQTPNLSPVYVGSGEVLDLPPLVMSFKNSVLQGQVLDEFNEPAAGIQIHAWDPENGYDAWAETGPFGVYSMPVTSGNWWVTAEPGLWQPYVHLDGPIQVFAPPWEMLRNVDFRLLTTNAIIQGYAVDNSSYFFLDWLDGWAWAELVLPAPADPLFFSDSPMWGGSFLLKARGGAEYNIGVSVPPYADYMPGGIGPVPLPEGESWLDVVVPLQAKDAWVVGSLVDGYTGDPVTGTVAELYGVDVFGNNIAGSVNWETGQFTLAAVAGDWWLGLNLDPASGYMAASPIAAVTLVSGQVLTQDLAIWPVESRLSGVVLDPDGLPLEGAFVMARGQSPFAGYYEYYTQSDSDGSYDLEVPEGVFDVSAALPGEDLIELGWFNPPDYTGVSVPYSATIGLPDLRFESADATIHGTLTFTGGLTISPTHPIYLWAWADSGQWTAVEVDFWNPDFATYTLPVLSGLTWHIGAFYDDWLDGVNYESDEIPVLVPVPLDDILQDILLHPTYGASEPLIFTLDVTQFQSIVLPNGVQIDIPAGALGSEGWVTLYIIPGGGPERGPGQTVMGGGFEVRAVDSNGQEIRQFSNNVLITIPYPSDEELAALGIDESQLAPAYFAELLGSWAVIDNYTQDTVNNTLQFQVDHFSRFDNLSITPTLPVNRIFLPLAIR